MRVFPDTNVLASAFATRGLCADLLRIVLAEHELITGEVVLDELRRTLTSRFGVPPATVADVEAFLRSCEVVARPEAPDPLAVRDESDRRVLASARAAAAGVLVTGDDDLLAVARRAGIRIARPREFWEELRRKGARRGRRA